MAGLNLNGEEMRKMTERIAAENKLSVEANTANGVTVSAGRTWSNGFGIGAFFKARSKKDVAAGVKGEWKW